MSHRFEMTFLMLLGSVPLEEVDAVILTKKRLSEKTPYEFNLHVFTAHQSQL